MATAFTVLHVAGAFALIGTPTILGKITTLIAILFAATSIGLALGGERGASVVREPPAASAPAVDPTSSAPRSRDRGK
ncbi:MAG: hypothetical protein HYU51_10335 [Candidatus Rokubacteria bacterium]|nr:hypothetical protein [Candidatus Rokubacteria bacterium]